MEGLGPSTQKTKTERRRRDFVVKTLQNVRVSMHSGHPSNSATIPSLHRPTRPTRPVDHPTGRPAHHLPPLGPTLGTRPDGPLSPGPLAPPRCFLFSWLARSLSRPGPATDREIENTPPWPLRPPGVSRANKTSSATCQADATRFTTHVYSNTWASDVRTPPVQIAQGKWKDLVARRCLASPPSAAAPAAAPVGRRPALGPIGPSPS